MSVSLPMQREQETARQSAPAQEPPQALKLLVVEDDPLVREVLSAYLREDRHEVEQAEDGSDGLQKFSSGNFNAVLTDRAMPEMNGDQLAIEIKKINPKMPVVLLTGYGEQMAGAGDQPEGVDVVMGKPFTQASLRDALNKALQIYRTAAGQ